MIQVDEAKSTAQTRPCNVSVKKNLSNNEIVDAKTIALYFSTCEIAHINYIISIQHTGPITPDVSPPIQVVTETPHTGTPPVKTAIQNSTTQPRLLDPFNLYNSHDIHTIEQENIRQRLAHEQATTSMREYLNSTVTNNSWLVTTIHDICRTAEPDWKPTGFQFENSIHAAEWNTKILKSYQYDYGKVVAARPGTYLTPGTEFRNLTVLQKIWGPRQNWTRLRNILSKGIEYPLITEQSDDERLSDLRAMVARGNHKSAQKPANLIALRKNIEKEIQHQYLIPTTVASIFKLKGATINPLGVSEQYSINTKGEKILKPRTCHDASFPAPSDYSVNLDHNMELLSECIYGQCLRRIIHSLHRARITYPTTVILLFKYDLDSAYRRLHVCAEHVVKTIKIVDDLAYILLRRPFGARCGPSIYSDVSESIFDLANDILHNPTWDPTVLHSPHTEILQPPEITSADDPFSRAKPLAIHIPLRETMTDGYIDDAITFAVQSETNIMRAQNALPLAVHTIFKPATPTDQKIREDPLSLRKLEGDGTPSEEKIVLGWLLNTISLSIHLPLDKAHFWITEIRHMLTPQYQVKSKQIESTIGRLNHIGYILPHARYFLNRIRKLFK